MRLMLFRSVAASLALALAATAATRPRYGGILRIETAEAIKSLDPLVAVGGRDAMASRHAQSLLFETLIVLNEHAIPQPNLATSWQHDASFRRWEFRIRPGVRFSDGATLNAANAAESLQPSMAGIGCNAQAAGTDVVLAECKAATPDLPMTLSLPECAIARRAARGGLAGTGTFKVTSSDGKRMALAANDDYWGGRPYLDGIEIQLEHPIQQQMLDLQLGNADVIEIAPEQALRMQQEGRRVISSAPMELLALRFNLNRPAAQDEQVRRVIARAIDRNSIYTVLLQRAGEASAGLLPQWMSGYSFLFSPVQPAALRPLRPLPTFILNSSPSQPAPLRPLRPLPTFILNYDFADALAKSVAERIAVNVRQAGISMQPVGENIGVRGANGEAWLARMGVDSTDASTALLHLAAQMSADKSKIGSPATPEQLFRAESALLEDASIIPLAHLPETYGLSPRVRNWAAPIAGGWPLADVWLEMQAGVHP